MIKEFRLPFKVKECPSESEKEIESIVLDCYRENPTHFNFKKVLSKIRDDSRLLQAFVVIIGKDIYKDILTDDPNEPGICGAGHPDGLALLRCTHERVVRHEVGHIFGLYHHGERSKKPNPTCIMNWVCRYRQFCDACKSELESWKTI